MIGITSRVKGFESVGTELRAHTVFHAFTDNLIAAGSVPVLLVPTRLEQIDNVLDRLDGLVLTGGGDIDPRLYGQDRHPTVRDVEHERDEFEHELARRA